MGLEPFDKLRDGPARSGDAAVVEIEIGYDGNLRCTAAHDASGTLLTTDAPRPRDSAAPPASFAPTDLLATALGTCMLTTMATAARHRGIDFSGARAAIRKELVTDPTRRIGRLTVELHVPHNLPDERRAALEWAARSCPVRRSIHDDVEVCLTFHWGAADVVESTVAG
jgi:putative redox protein